MFTKRISRNSLGYIRIGKCFKSTIVPIKPKKPESKNKFSYKLYLWSFAAGGVLGLNLPLYSFFEHYADPLPTRERDVVNYKIGLENELNSLPIVKKLSADENYIKIRAWENIDDSSVLNQTMTSATLRQPGGFAIQPMVFINELEKETITVVHLGKSLTGYPFLVHGGILATILDETLKRCSILSYKSKNKTLKYDDESTYSSIRGTKLTLSYKFPTIANNFIVVKCKSEDANPSDGSVSVKLKIQSIKGRDLVVGEGVFQHERSKKWIFW